MALWKSRRAPPPRTSHGSARWATDGDLERVDLLRHDRSGITLGYYGQRSELRYRGDRHRLIVAPVRSGKFVSCIGPMLLDDIQQSAIMIDIKGEGLAITRRWRTSQRDPAYHLNPYGAHHMGSHKYNPLRLLDPSKPTFIADADILVETMTVPFEKGGGGDMHFEPAGKYLVNTLLRYVVADPAEEGKRTLNRVRSLLMLSAQEFRALFERMSLSSAAFGLVRQGANGFLQKQDRERTGVVSTAQRQTLFLDDPMIKDVLRGHDFSFADLKRKTGTVYIVLPADVLPVRREWLRLMIACALIELKRPVAESGRPQVAFIVDEFPALGTMQILLNDYAVAAGYGVQFHLVCQNFSQLQERYDKAWDTFVSSAGILQAFATQDNFTAEYISKMLGVKTIEVTSESGGRSSSSSGGSFSSGWSTSATQRPLLLPDEIRTLEQSRGFPTTLILPNSASPTLAGRWLYYGHEPFAGRADPPPQL
jgi:type IV secretion system protein VirD4